MELEDELKVINNIKTKNDNVKNGFSINIIEQIIMDNHGENELFQILQEYLFNDETEIKQLSVTAKNLILNYICSNKNKKLRFRRIKDNRELKFDKEIKKNKLINSILKGSLIEENRGLVNFQLMKRNHIIPKNYYNLYLKTHLCLTRAKQELLSFEYDMGLLHQNLNFDISDSDKRSPDQVQRNGLIGKRSWNDNS